MPEELRLVGYIRVSKVAGREGESFQSPRSQKDAAKAVVTLTPGARIVKWITDLDESGGTMDRPGANEAVEMVNTGEADGIVVAALDRWARTMEALEVIEQWAREGKVFLSAAEKFDTSTSMGRFALGMMLLVAKLFRDRAVEQWDTSCRNAIARGVHVTVPYGYRRGDAIGRDHRKGGTRGAPLVIDESEAPVVRRIFAERIGGAGHATIAAGLNADEIPSPRGGLWNRQAVLAMLRVRAYMGEAHRGKYMFAEAHEPIVSREDWERAQSLRGRSRQNDKSLLVGLARCAGCGYVMGAGGDGRGARRYNCTRNHSELTCPSPTTAPAERLEEFVSDEFLARYGDRSGVEGAGYGDPAIATTTSALARARTDYTAWRDDVDMRTVLGETEYREGLLAKRAAVEQRERDHADAVRRSDARGLSVSRAVWESLTLPERRLLLRTGMEAVVLTRASSTHTPLTDRVQLLWTGELDHDGSRRGIAKAVRGNGNP